MKSNPTYLQVQSICVKKLRRLGKLAKKHGKYGSANTSMLAGSYRRVERTARLILETSLYILSRHVRAYIANGFGLPPGDTKANSLLQEYYSSLAEISKNLREFFDEFTSPPGNNVSPMETSASNYVPPQYWFLDRLREDFLGIVEKQLSVSNTGQMFLT